MLADHLDLVVLDMAGTTLAVADEVPAALQGAFAESGMAASLQAISRVRGRSKPEAIRTLVGELRPGADAADGLARRLLVRFQELLRERLASGAQPVDGAADALRWIRAQGVTVVLTTGFDRGLATFLLERVGWDDRLLDGVVTADDVSRGRPDPEIVLLAMELVGARDPGRVMVVGDTIADLETARAAGAGFTIGVLTGAHDRETLSEMPHTALLPSVADLPGWLDARLG